MPEAEAGADAAGLWETLRTLPRPVVTLLCGVAVNRLGSLLQIFLVLYLTHIGLTPAAAGVVLTSFGAGSIVGDFASGTISDTIGPRRTITLSMLGSAATIGAVPYVHAYPGLLLVCAGAGVATHLYYPAALAMLAQLTPAARLVLTSATFRFALNVGATLAPIIGIFLATRSYTAVFTADAASSLLFALVALVALPKDSVPAADGPGAESEQQPAGGYLTVLRDRRYLLVITGILIAAIAEVQYQSVLPLQVKADGFSTALYGTVVAINGAMVIVLEMPLTPLVQRMRIRTSISVGSMLIGAGMAMFGLPAGAWPFIAGAVVWTLGEIMSAPSVSAYPALVAPARLRGRYIGALGTSQTIGYAVGPLIGTLLFEHVGARMWLLCLVLGVVGGLSLRVGVVQPTGATGRRVLGSTAAAEEAPEPAPEVTTDVPAPHAGAVDVPRPG